MPHPLDGTYRISTTNSHNGALEKRSDGKTILNGGQTERTDDAGCKWTSTFEIISDTSVKMTSIADPSNAAIDFVLFTPDGAKTTQSVTYEATLKLAQKGEDQIQMSGQIQYGQDVLFLTMRKIST